MVSEDDIQMYAASLSRWEEHKIPSDIAPQPGGLDFAVEFKASAWRDTRHLYSGDIGNSGRHGSALQAAAFYGHENVVDMLLDLGADINLYTGYYGTALQTGSTAGHLTIVERLVDKGAHVNTLTGFHGNPLTAAASGGHIQVVEYLLSHGAHIDARGGEYGTALAAAARNQSKEIVALLLERGADPGLKAGIFGYALQAAAIGVPHSAMSQKAEEYIEDYSKEEFPNHARPAELEDYAQSCRDRLMIGNMRSLGIFGRMLQRAAGGAFGNTLEVFTSIDGGGDEEVKETLLELWEDCKDSVYIIELLLDHGANINACGGMRHNALTAGIMAQMFPVVMALVKRGGNINQDQPECDHDLNNRPYSPLEVALRYGTLEMASFLIGLPNFNMKRCLEHTFALHEAVRVSPSITSRLLEHGAQVDAEAHHCFSPLHYAVKGRNVKAARILVEAGADTNAIGYEYSKPVTPLEMTENFENEDMVQLLCEHGASVGSQTSTLKAPLMHLTHRRPHEKEFMKERAVLKVLINHNADINAGSDRSSVEGKPQFLHDFIKYRPLYLLLTKTCSIDLEFIRLFLDSPKLQFSEHATNYLWCAARYTLAEAVQLLLDSGAIATTELVQDIEREAAPASFYVSYGETEESLRSKWQQDRAQVLSSLHSALHNRSAVSQSCFLNGSI